MIDFRSDTVTKPTPEMRAAMASAEVGDDVYGEDPNVNRLQELAAEKMGMETGLFVSSGTMGNLTAILAHCERGDEVILGNKSHTFLFEAGGISALGGVHSCQLVNLPDGSLALDDIEMAIRPDDPHDPVTKLVCLENTHNRCGGTFLSPRYMNEVSQITKNHDLKLHLDGARIFNAAVAQRLEAKELTSHVDSVTFCISKGLCAPVGSILCGTKGFIKKAHRIRKMLGGGMRQAGIIAAAGIVALESMVDRLVEDHIRAKRLADGLRNIPGLSLPQGPPMTNMVFVTLDDGIPLTTSEIQEKLGELGVMVGVTAKRQFRLVLHFWISDKDLKTTEEAFNMVMREALQD